MAVTRRRRTAPDDASESFGTDDERVSRSLAKDPTELMPYRPTPSINPPRPRTQAAGYDRETKTMTVEFREGAVYEYYDVQPNEWRNFRRVKSPGKAINRTFNGKPYARRRDLET